MSNLTPRERELLRITAADLQYIADRWNVNPTDDDLRRDAAMLRRLLVEGDLLRAVQLLETSFYILATIDITGLIEIAKTEFYLAGGGRIVGVGTVQALLVTAGKDIKHDFIKGSRNQKYDIGQFMATPCLVYEGDAFNRVELIKYIANKSGGAHYEIEEKKLARMRALDNAHQYMRTLGERSPVYYELMSAGQALTKTKYSQQLLRKIKEELAKY